MARFQQSADASINASVWEQCTSRHEAALMAATQKGIANLDNAFGAIESVVVMATRLQSKCET